MISIWSSLGRAAFVAGAVAWGCAGVLSYVTAIIGEARAADSFAKDLVVKGLTIVDAKGKPRCKGKATHPTRAAESTPRVRLYDEMGTLRAALMLIEGEPWLGFSDEKGTTRAALILIEGDPVLALRDEKGKPRAELMLTKGRPGLVLSDEKGTMRARLMVIEGEHRLALYDEKGGLRAVFGSAGLEVTRTGETVKTAPSSVTLFDKDGNVMWKAP
jgi:hypothetical protein